MRPRPWEVIPCPKALRAGQDPGPEHGYGPCAPCARGGEPSFPDLRGPSVACHHSVKLPWGLRRGEGDTYGAGTLCPVEHSTAQVSAACAL